MALLRCSPLFLVKLQAQCTPSLISPRRSFFWDRPSSAICLHSASRVDGALTKKVSVGAAAVFRGYRRWSRDATVMLSLGQALFDLWPCCLWWVARQLIGLSFFFFFDLRIFIMLFFCCFLLNRIKPAFGWIFQKKYNSHISASVWLCSLRRISKLHIKEII